MAVEGQGKAVGRQWRQKAKAVPHSSQYSSSSVRLSFFSMSWRKSEIAACSELCERRNGAAVKPGAVGSRESRQGMPRRE